MWRRFKSFPFLSAVILLALNIRLVTSGLTWVGVGAFAVTVIWFGVEFTRWLTGRRGETGHTRTEPSAAGEEPEEPLVSLVYFLSEARSANETMIREAVSAALGIVFDDDSENAETFVMPLAAPGGKGNQLDGITRFLVHLPQGAFAVLVSDSPYIEDPGDFAENAIRDKRLRSAIESHRAWLSVDLMEEAEDGTARDEAYRVIGRILCSLAGPDCLAVYSPELQRCNEFDLSLLDTLGGEEPLALFDEPTFEPIIEIADNDPKMAAAVQEAVTRWPEFVAEFRRVSPEERDRFIIKAEFREGDVCEYMWVAVEEILEGRLQGVLMNDPHELLEIHRGAVVEVELDRLNDWIYSHADGSHVGGFTLDVLAEDEE